MVTGAQRPCEVTDMTHVPTAAVARMAASGDRASKSAAWCVARLAPAVGRYDGQRPSPPPLASDKRPCQAEKSTRGVPIA